MKNKYRKPLLACYLGFITQAIVQNAGDNLRAGMLVSCIFPIILVLSTCLLKLKKEAGDCG